MFLVNSRHRLVFATFIGFSREDLHLQKARLIPKLRRQFAEFLRLGSLKRLGILSPPTCVGLRYGSVFCSTRGFSWKRGLTDFAQSEDLARPPPRLHGSTFIRMPPAYKESPQPSRGSATLLRPRLLQRSYQVQEY